MLLHLRHLQNQALPSSPLPSCICQETQDMMQTTAVTTLMKSRLDEKTYRDVGKEAAWKSVSRISLELYVKEYSLLLGKADALRREVIKAQFSPIKRKKKIRQSELFLAIS